MYWGVSTKVCTIENNINLNSIFCLIKSSKIDFFTSILPDYVAHDITKEFEKKAGFLLRCQNLIHWNTPEIMHFVAWHFLSSPVLPLAWFTWPHNTSNLYYSTIIGRRKVIGHKSSSEISLLQDFLNWGDLGWSVNLIPIKWMMIFWKYYETSSKRISTYKRESDTFR